MHIPQTNPSQSLMICYMKMIDKANLYTGPKVLTDQSNSDKVLIKPKLFKTKLKTDFKFTIIRLSKCVEFSFRKNV